MKSGTLQKVLVELENKVEWRQDLLKHIPGNKKKFKAWQTTWTQLEKAEISKSQQLVREQARPWAHQCTGQELLLWRDHLFKDCSEDLEMVEQEEELVLCRDMCLTRRTKKERSRIQGALQSWVGRKLKNMATKTQERQLQKDLESARRMAASGYVDQTRGTRTPQVTKLRGYKACSQTMHGVMEIGVSSAGKSVSGSHWNSTAGGASPQAPMSCVLRMEEILQDYIRQQQCPSSWREQYQAILLYDPVIGMRGHAHRELKGNIRWAREECKTSGECILEVRDSYAVSITKLEQDCAVVERLLAAKGPTAFQTLSNHLVGLRQAIEEELFQWEESAARYHDRSHDAFTRYKALTVELATARKEDGTGVSRERRQWGTGRNGLAGYHYLRAPDSGGREGGCEMAAARAGTRPSERAYDGESGSQLRTSQE